MSGDLTLMRSGDALTVVDRQHELMVAQAVNMLTSVNPGQYGKQPKFYLGMLTAVLRDCSPEVIARVVDPRHGLPGRLKFVPSIAEVNEACQDEAEALQSGWPADWRGQGLVTETACKRDPGNLDLCSTRLIQRLQSGESFDAMFR